MCGNYVAVAQQGFTATDIGKVAIYEKFSRDTGSFNKVAEIEGKVDITEKFVHSRKHNKLQGRT